jgi:hypothetical protein
MQSCLPSGLGRPAVVLAHPFLCVCHFALVLQLGETADKLRTISNALHMDVGELVDPRDALLRSLVAVAAATTTSLRCYFLRLEELREGRVLADEKALGLALPAMKRLRTLDDAGLARDRRLWVATLHSCLATLQQPHVLQWYRVLANLPALVEDSASALDRYMWGRVGGG